MSLAKLENDENGIESPFFILGDGDVGIAKIYATKKDGKKVRGIKFTLLDKKYKLREKVKKDNEIPEITTGILLSTKDDYDNIIKILTELKNEFENVSD